MPWRYGCQGTGNDSNCATTTTHDHCTCGLPMAVGQKQCPMCVLEGTVPLDVDEMEWDGRTYPSWRNRRTRGQPDAYILLAAAIGGMRLS